VTHCDDSVTDDGCDPRNHDVHRCLQIQISYYPIASIHCNLKELYPAFTLVIIITRGVPVEHIISAHVKSPKRSVPGLECCTRAVLLLFEYAHDHSYNDPDCPTNALYSVQTYH
jgi:hypothetical protein